MLTSSNYSAEAYVTAANPAPGRVETAAYPMRSGTGYTYLYTSQSDGGIGLNVYIAGGVGPSGAIPVSQTNPTQISLSGVTIGGVIEVTTSLGHPVEVTGSVYVLNPGGSLSGTLTATITGVVEVSQSNVQTTQSVYILQQPIGVTGAVGVSGTASVFVEGFGGPVEVFGGVSVSGGTVTVTSSQASPVWITGTSLEVTFGNNTTINVSATISGVNVVSGALQTTGTVFVQNPVTGVFVLGTASVSVSNLPPTQSVFVVNQQSSSITGTVTVSGTGVFQVTGSVFVLNPSSASLVISGALEVTSSQANPVWVTGNFSISGSGASTVVFIPPNASPSASVVTSVAQTSSIDILLSASDRLGYTIFNSSSDSLAIFFGPSTGTASYVLSPKNVYESQDVCFVGDIYGRWLSDGSGSAVITEFFGDTSGTSSGSFTLNVGNFPPVQQVTGTVTVEGISISGSTPIEAYPNALENIQFTRKKQLFDLDSDSVNYIGYAVLGTPTSAGAWAIKRLSFNVSGNLEASEWSSITASWSNRISEAYN